MILRRRLGAQSSSSAHKMVLRERTSAPNSPCMFSPKLKRPTPPDFDEISTPRKMLRSSAENAPMSTSTPKQGGVWDNFSNLTLTGSLQHVASA